MPHYMISSSAAFEIPFNGYIQRVLNLSLQPTRLSYLSVEPVRYQSTKFHGGGEISFNHSKRAEVYFRMPFAKRGPFSSSSKKRKIEVSSLWDDVPYQVPSTLWRVASEEGTLTKRLYIAVLKAPSSIADHGTHNAHQSPHHLPYRPWGFRLSGR